MNLRELLEHRLIFGKFSFALMDLIMVLLIFLAAKLAIWLVKKVALRRFFSNKSVDVGRQYAVSQFLTYFIYISAVLLMLESLSFSLSVLWASSAALLVGIGLGLQDSFKDLVSGFIILVEGTVEVGDVVQVDGFVARVQSI